ncbi:MAG: DUF2336 domain-containing protein [Pseudomonadota bacterium]
MAPPAPAVQKPAAPPVLEPESSLEASLRALAAAFPSGLPNVSLPSSGFVPAPEFEPAAPSVASFDDAPSVAPAPQNTPGPDDQQDEPLPDDQPLAVSAEQAIEDEERTRRSAEIVRELLDLMAASGGSVQPQERALAADTLLRMLERIPDRSKVELAERVSIMEDPPAMIVSQLVLDENLEIAGPLIERGTVVSDQDLLAVIETCNIDKCIMVARRRHVPQGVANALIDTQEPNVLLALARNGDVTLAPDVLQRLTDLARTQAALQAPLVTRTDMTPQIAFDLFWALPTELRRYVFSRFLTDSGMLERILRVTMAAEGDDDSVWDGQSFPPDDQIAEAAALVEHGRMKEAMTLLARLARVTESSAHRIVADPSGEPLTIIFKAIGISRADFAETVERWRLSSAAMLRDDRDTDELTTLFDLLSYNKARVVLTYWDWLSRKTRTNAGIGGVENAA